MVSIESATHKYRFSKKVIQEYVYFYSAKIDRNICFAIKRNLPELPAQDIGRHISVYECINSHINDTWGTGNFIGILDRKMLSSRKYDAVCLYASLLNSSFRNTDTVMTRKEEKGCSGKSLLIISTPETCSQCPFYRELALTNEDKNTVLCTCIVNGFVETKTFDSKTFHSRTAEGCPLVRADEIIG